MDGRKSAESTAFRVSYDGRKSTALTNVLRNSIEGKTSNLRNSIDGRQTTAQTKINTR